MSSRFLARIGALTSVVIVVLLAQMPVTGQQAPAGAKTVTVAAASKSWVPSRTPWGDPDLQGVYNFTTATPLQRPAELAGKDSYTEAELAQLEKKAEQAAAIRNSEARTGGDYNAFWTSPGGANEGGRLTGRTSLIVDPENGQEPPLTARAEKIREQLLARATARGAGVPPFKTDEMFKTIRFDTWEDHTIFNRSVAAYEGLEIEL